MVAQGCIPKRLLGRPDEALGGGNQGPSAPGWGRQHHSQRDPPFVPSKRLPDWAFLELSPSVESCGCGLGPSPVGRSRPPPLGWAPLRPLPGICALQLPLLNL